MDGKVATAFSDVTNSSQYCSVCGVKPTQMNNIPLLSQAHFLPGDGLKYSLSTFMSCTYHTN